MDLNVVAYLDDLLNVGRNEADHLMNLDSVLQSLQENGLRAKESKCEFGKTGSHAGQERCLSFPRQGEGDTWRPSTHSGRRVEGLPGASKLLWAFCTLAEHPACIAQEAVQR